MKNIYVSDVTLKAINENEIALSFREKLALSEKLDLLKVDAIELPALINSKENEIIYKTIASSVKNAVIKIAVGDNLESLLNAVNCVKSAKNFSLQVVFPISTATMEYNYHLKAPLMLEKIKELVLEAVKYNCDVEFVALDAFRAEEGFLNECVKVATSCGATSITVCDDNGQALPEDFKIVVEELKSIIIVK